MRRSLLLIAALVAGCIAPPAEPVGPPVSAATSFALTECREQIGIFPVEDADAASYMPDGFGPLPPLPPDVHPDADPTGTSATLLYVGFFCDAPEPVAFLVPWFPAVPPEDLREPNVTYHAVAPVVVTSHEGLAAWLAAARVPRANASIEQAAALPEMPPAITTTMSGEGEEVGLVLTGSSPRSEAATPEEWLRLFIVQEREIVAILDLHISEHVHWQFGPARAEGAVRELAAPTQPGLSTHSAPGMMVQLRAGG